MIDASDDSAVRTCKSSSLHSPDQILFCVTTGIFLHRSLWFVPTLRHCPKKGTLVVALESEGREI